MSKILKKVKKYWNSQPCNINHSNEPEFTEKYFKDVRKKKYFVERHILNFANFKFLLIQMKMSINLTFI
jgi:hypothetical protein